MSTELKLATPTDVTALHRALSNALLFVEKSGLIPAIAAVRFEVTGSKLEVISTDRYRLFVEPLRLSDETADGCEFLLEAADAKTSLGLLKGAASATITVDNTKANVEAGLSSAAFVLLDAAFPRWRSLLPSGDEVPTQFIGFNPAFLADLGRVDTGRKKSRSANTGVDPVRVGMYGTKKPTKVTWVVDNDAPAPMLLLMPYGLA